MKIKTKEQRTSFDVAWWHENPQKLFNLSFHSFRSGIFPWQIPNVPIMMLEIFWQTSSSLHTHTHTYTHAYTHTSSILASPAAPDDAMPQFPFHILHHGVFLFIFLCRVDSCAFCPCATRSGWLHPWNTCQLICATATAATFCYFKNALPQRFGQRRWRVWRVSSIESQHVFCFAVCFCCNNSKDSSGIE